MLFHVCIAHKVVWLLHVLLFCIVRDLFLMLLYGCIAHKHIWLPHELSFCVEQDFILMLLDSCIALKDIWVLHVLIFYVQQDFLLLLPDSCIARNDIWVLHVALLFSARCPFDVARCLHCLQEYLTPSCIIVLCHAKLFLCDTWLPQRSQFTFFSQIGAFSGARNHQKCSISGTL